MAITASRLKKGSVVRHKGDLFLVLDCVVRTPPNSASFIFVTLKNLNSGKTFDLHCSVGEVFDVLEKETKSVDFSYQDKDVYVFMDPVSFETYEIHEDFVGDDKYFLLSGTRCQILFVEGRPVQISVPEHVDLTVVETQDFVAKGNTSGNVLKDAKLETGLVVQVPHFIKNGDILKIRSTSKEYVSRVS